VWFIAGAKTKAREVDGGRFGEGYCAGCQKVVVFRECDVMDTFHAFFVELFEHTQRRMVCRACGEDQDVEEFFKTARALHHPPSSPPKPAKSGSLWNRQREHAKDSYRGDNVEKELLELKRKLGKKDTS
jgi:hypothetical protein